MKHFIIILLCLTLILSTACAQPIATNSQENENTTQNNITLSENKAVTTDRIIGSEMLMLSRKYFDTFDDFLKHTISIENKNESAKIVIGRVESVAGIREEKIREEYDEQRHSPPTFTVTDYNIVVEKTLFGKEVNSFVLSLLGTPDNHWGITKPDIGDKLMLFVYKNNQDGFALTSFEEAMFKINEDETVYSFSNQEITAQFDGKQLKVLENEINRILDSAKDVIPKDKD
jgi:hypothetical protein